MPAPLHPTQPSLWRDYFPHWDLPQRIARPLMDSLSLGPCDAEELAFAQAVEALPKVELHVHLEAAVPAAFYETLNQRLRLFAPHAMPVYRAPFANLREFIQAWLDHTRLVDGEAVLAEMACEFVAARARSQIRYTEAYISPFDFAFGRERLGMAEPPLNFGRALASYLAGLKQGMAKYPGYDVRLIVDTLWTSSPKECDVMLGSLREILASPESKDSISGASLLVAIGLGGLENLEAIREKLAFIERCRNLGLRLDIHSGETTKESEHQQALVLLRPDRVSHGIAPGVAERSDGTGVFFSGGLAVCPISNLLTGAFRGRLQDHPIKQMLALGVPCCVNTDDPLLFGTTLTLEFVALRRALGIDLSAVYDLIRRARALAFVNLPAERELRCPTNQNRS